MKSARRLAVIVDDVEPNRVLAKAYLEILGWEVQDFADPYIALAFVLLSPPDAMLIDIRMPGLSGDDMARRIRSYPHMTNVRLIGYTAHAMEGQLRQFANVGFNHVLTKPVLLTDMRRVFG